jgi:hypothetical protein
VRSAGRIAVGRPLAIGHDVPTDEEQLKQVNWLMVLSPLEIVNALGGSAAGSKQVAVR